MDRETTIAQGLRVTEDRAGCDAACKHVLSEKTVLARIIVPCRCCLNGKTVGGGLHLYQRPFRQTAGTGGVEPREAVEAPAERVAVRRPSLAFRIMKSRRVSPVPVPGNSEKKGGGQPGQSAVEF